MNRIDKIKEQLKWAELSTEEWASSYAEDVCFLLSKQEKAMAQLRQWEQEAKEISEGNSIGDSRSAYTARYAYGLAIRQLEERE